MNFSINKRALLSSIGCFLFSSAAIYFTYAWFSAGMPLYSEAHDLGKKEEFIPLLGTAVLFVVLSIASGLDAYIYLRNDTNDG
ncbi:hypothetical protein SIN8267_01106 [Sinobacterium norvegicum]|uniref:Uncharacterized protein n=1 Tax=Sinobacterium norvegicum TaxID=1641715 RepID=A0ABM9ACT2_9GAMM|nr:hypothetical protein SIN8267_01106 [Sinobacterium norvegicum]